MSSKYAGHTPGPWHWVNSKTDLPFDFDAEWDGEGRPSLRTVAERKRHEDDIRALPDWIVDAEPMQYGNDAANATLIADAWMLPLLLRQRDELAAALRETLANLKSLRDELPMKDTAASHQMILGMGETGRAALARLEA
jgi:hypothetical protein